ncbi:MAG: M23 family metallopeptidase [Patescibacteria group bacterium]
MYYNTDDISVPTVKLTQKTKVVKKNIPAIQIGGKLLVIKGYSEESSSVLNALEKENISLEQIDNASPTGEMIPATVEVTVAEDAGTTVLDQEGTIAEYEVIQGDTIEAIAKKYNITPETILWANDLKKTSQIKVGQKLVILPVSGVSYVIRAGDTVSEISEKFHISQKELTEFNDLEDGRLIVGDVIIIPGGKLVADVVKNPSTGTKDNTPDNNTPVKSSGYFSKPVANGTKTQGIHGHNGIDIAASFGTPILAARDGIVSLVRGGDGWNGGYGNYVVITHDGGVQTLYAHMSGIDVLQGQKVTRGQQVGKMGNTGQSTGVHLHFEVRGAKNPF